MHINRNLYKEKRIIMKTAMYIEKNIEKLKLSVAITNKLKENNILIINDLWQLKRTDLKKMGFTNDDINSIIIQLQLLGLDLNKKKY